MKTPISPDQKTVFVITNLGEDGLRHLSAPANQSRYHYATQSDAEMHLEAMLANTSEDTLASVHGKQAIGTYRVEECECYPGGDCKRTVFDI